jgi:P-type E1-E2 ATPase
MVQIGELVVGDVVKITQGMEVPVDGIIITSSGVLSNESAMTGESDELRKESLEVCKQKREEKEHELKFSGDKAERGHHDIPTPVLLSGTQITTGDGWFICIVVGKGSCAGKIRQKLEQDSDE